jgi:hypothetical protein
MPAADLALAGVVTRGDPVLVVRAIRSYAENFRRYRRAVRFVVSSDEQQPGSRVAMEEALRTLVSEGMELAYAGLPEKRAFAQALAQEAGVDVRIPEFALLPRTELGSSCGANRNAVLLEAARAAALLLDDDTVCELAVAPGSDGQVARRSGRRPVEIFPFDGAEACQRWVERCEVDFVGEHGRWLGQEGVRLTCSGLYGDSGSSSSWSYLLLEPDEQRHLAPDEEHYRRARVSRQVWKGVRRVTLARSSFCQATAIGVDHRRVLPPFFPLFRSSDATLGQHLRMLEPEAPIAYLPVAVLHAPLPARMDPPDAIVRGGQGIIFQEIYACCLGTFTPGAGDPSAQLPELGRHVRQLVRRPPDQLRALVRPFLDARSAALIAAHERALASAGREHPGLAEDLRQSLDLLRQGRTRADQDVPRELRRDGDVTGAGAWSVTAELLGRYGELLEAWPALVEATARLHQREIALHRPV